MTTESDIRNILSRGMSPEFMAEEICKFMTWDKEELIRIIMEKGTDRTEQHSKIIGHFWNKGGK